MAILHGFWMQRQQQSCLFVWAEVWRRVASEAPKKRAAKKSTKSTKKSDSQENGTEGNSVIDSAMGSAIDSVRVRSHPYAATQTEFLEFLQAQQQREALSWSVPEPAPWQSCWLSLPAQLLEDGEVVPLHSSIPPEEWGEDVVLHPWQIEGLCLSAPEAMVFLQALPLHVAEVREAFVAGDVRFWSHVVRWGLDLLARMKFLPSLQRDNEGAIALWQPLLDSASDRSRLHRYSQQMPLACRMYLESEPGAIANSLPQPAEVLLSDFLQAVLDAQIRQVASAQTLPSTLKDTLAGQWLQALANGQSGNGQSGNGQRLDADPVPLNRLHLALQNWAAPLQQASAQDSFRACFKLQPPAQGETQWRLEYFLQAVDDSNCLVPAEVIWQQADATLTWGDRPVPTPWETLLRGLGLACRLYPPIEASLQTPTPTRCILTPDQAYEFIKSTAWWFQENGLGAILPEGLASRSGWASRLGVSIRAQDANAQPSQKLGLKSLLNFKWELSIGKHRLTKREFEQLAALDSPLVEIQGEWVELRPQDIQAAREFFKQHRDDLSLSLEDALRLATGDTQLVEKLPVVDFEASGTLQQLLDTLTQNRTLEEIETPKGFKGSLRPYQARGVGWLLFLQQWGLGACLADDMGLGKTIQLIAFLLQLKEREALLAPVLLVCPTSVLGNWEREVKRFAPSLGVMVHHGDKRLKGKTLAKEAARKHIIVTSYALLYRDLKDFQAIPWQGVVLDEAQNIKNPDAKQSKAARDIAADFRIALTGTPLENRLTELWAILEFLNPGYLGTKQFFQRRFAMPIEKYGDEDSLQALRSLVQPFILRRLKTDKDIIQDLPEKQEMTVFCGLSPDQASLYQQTVEQAIATIDTTEGIQRRGAILALLTRLKQICNHPALLDGKSNGKSSSKSSKSKLDESFRQSSGKLQRLEAMLEELIAEGDRALIFTQFAEWGKLLQPYLAHRLGRNIFFLYGSTSKAQREEMVDRFQHDPQAPPVMILSLKAGGTGLNLTRANHVFHFDRWWNPAVENQATDRVFRIGQKRNVQVHKFVCSGTLEEKIHDIIEGKKALAENIVGGGEDWLTELDTDQLRNLLILDRTAVIDEE